VVVNCGRKRLRDDAEVVVRRETVALEREPLHDKAYDTAGLWQNSMLQTFHYKGVSDCRREAAAPDTIAPEGEHR
jgi:hypothetical protein